MGKSKSKNNEFEIQPYELDVIIWRRVGEITNRDDLTPTPEEIEFLKRRRSCGYGKLTVHEKNSPYLIGDAYTVLTVTHHFVGSLIAIRGSMLVLAESSWVPDLGRFHEATSSGVFAEVEPNLSSEKRISYIAMNAVSTSFPWHHPLPTAPK